MSLNISPVTAYPYAASLRAGAPSARFSGCMDTLSRHNGQEYQHQTSLFRLEKQTLALPDFLKRHFPNGCPIYDYACSDGSETYSIAITLSENGLDASRYPIVGRDISPTIIGLAQSGRIKMIPHEFADIRKLFPDSKPRRYFRPTHEKPGFQTGLYPGECEDTWRQRYENNAEIYDVSPFLKQRVKFELGDLGADRFEQPGLILFNNQLYHLSKRRQKTLLQNLYANCQPGSILIAHGADIKIAKAAGFELMADDPNQHPYPAFIKKTTATDAESPSSIPQQSASDQNLSTWKAVILRWLHRN